MKTFFPLSILIVLIGLVACQKQQTEEEKNAEIERRVQERLAAEHQADQEKALAQRQADLDAREKALAEKEKATPAEAPEQTERSVSEASESRIRGSRENVPARGYSTFYTRLESYGDWIEAGDYGYVFHPREAESARWRPYTNGRWVYTDAGWTWISQEPFGWATYHYGRWTRLRGIGWVWVPGNQWAPAWVSWRTSNDYVGWAPLPPEARFDQRTGIRNWADNYYDIGPDQYCFVASREFGADQVERTLLPPERNVTIVNQTINVTNITYSNTTVVNEGPNYEQLRTLSREPVQRFRLERNINVDVSTEPPRAAVQGETVVIAAPVISAPRPSERPPTIKQTVAQVAVDLGWAAIANHEEAKRAREKMKSEATPPPNAPSKKFNRAAAETTPPTQAGATSEASRTPAATSATAATTPVSAATTSPAQTTAPAETAAATMPPRATPTPRSSVTPSAAPSASAFPTAAQRRGRLLVPSTTPTPRPTATATATPAPSKAPPFTEPMSTPSAPPEMKRGKGKTQGQPNRAPRSEVSAATTAASAAPSATSTPAPSENLTKKEKKEQKREEKKEMKRERREGGTNATASPAATPQ